MASGRSRKVVTDDDDMSKIEFETSEDVDVIPTFDSMRLREDLVRGIYAYGKVTNSMQFVWNQWYDVVNLFKLIVRASSSSCRLWETISYSAACNKTHRQRKRCDCSVSIISCVKVWWRGTGCISCVFNTFCLSGLNLAQERRQLFPYLYSSQLTSRFVNSNTVILKKRFDC